MSGVVTDYDPLVLDSGQAREAARRGRVLGRVVVSRWATCILTQTRPYRLSDGRLWVCVHVCGAEPIGSPVMPGTGAREPRRETVDWMTGTRREGPDAWGAVEDVDGMTPLF